MKLSIKAVSIVGLLILSSCGRRHEEQASKDPQLEALPVIETFELTALVAVDFYSVDIDKRCIALEETVEYLFKNHLPEWKFDDEIKCLETINIEDIASWYQIIARASLSETQYGLTVIAGTDGNSAQTVTIILSDLSNHTSVTRPKFNPELHRKHPALYSILHTLRGYISRWPNTEPRVYGMKFDDFVVKTKEMAQEGIRTENGTATIDFQDMGSSTSGKLSKFTYEPVGSLFGCEDQECLAQKEYGYLIQNRVLAIYPLPREGFKRESLMITLPNPQNSED